MNPINVSQQPHYSADFDTSHVTFSQACQPWAADACRRDHRSLCRRSICKQDRRGDLATLAEQARRCPTRTRRSNDYVFAPGDVMNTSCRLVKIVFIVASNWKQ